MSASGFGRGAEPATYALIGLNVLAFLAELFGGGGRQRWVAAAR